MKRLLIVLSLFLLSFTSFSQVSGLDSMINKAIFGALTKTGVKFDSVANISGTSTAAIVNLDTFRIATNSYALYSVTALANNTTTHDLGFGFKNFEVRNINGVNQSLASSLGDNKGWTGGNTLALTQLTVNVVNNNLILQGINSSAIPVKWNIIWTKVNGGTP